MGVHLIHEDALEIQVIGEGVLDLAVLDIDILRPLNT